MNKEVLEMVLKQSDKDCSIQRIIEIETEPAIPKGENYSSIISRIKMKVVLGNGRIAKRTLIMKHGKTGETADKIEKEFNPLGVETKVYKNILKEMEYLMEEFNETEERIWCKFICYDPDSRSILLEDLKAKGFSCANRQTGLDLEHAKLALRSLGRFHAMAKILEERGVISKDSYKPYLLLSDNKYSRAFPYAGMKKFGEAIKMFWGPKWENIAEKMMMPVEVYMKKLVESAKLKEGDFTCLNHGDCWSNNMMFKYDSRNLPVSVRLLDFQGPHYNTPCLDVAYFMSIGVQPKVRRQNYKLLLECYHNSLEGVLEKYGYTETKPSLEDIEEVMERLSFFSLCIIAFLYPVMTYEQSKEAFDIEKILLSNGEEGFDMNIYKTEGLAEKIGLDLEYLINKHF